MDEEVEVYLLEKEIRQTKVEAMTY